MAAIGMAESVKALGRAHGYSTVKCIGKGSFGLATLVRDAAGDFLVMKTTSIDLSDPRQREAAAAEVSVLASLKHPYIVRYRESFFEDGTLAIVMDYADGGDLDQRIKTMKNTRSHFPETRVRRWFTQMVLGLQYLHGRNVLHRDYKPSNLFLTKQDQLRIGDFGISKIIETNSVKDTMQMGTPFYMSPEILGRGLYSFAGDVWSLGCVLYELCSLRVPFEATSLRSLRIRIAGEATPAIPSSYSPQLRAVALSMLKRDDTARPSTGEIIKGNLVQQEMSRMLQEKAQPPSHASSSSATLTGASAEVPAATQLDQDAATIPPSPLPLATLVRGAPSSSAAPADSRRQRPASAASPLSGGAPKQQRPASAGGLSQATARVQAVAVAAPWGLFSGQAPAAALALVSKQVPAALVPAAQAPEAPAQTPPPTAVPAPLALPVNNRGALAPAPFTERVAGVKGSIQTSIASTLGSVTPDECGALEDAPLADRASDDEPPARTVADLEGRAKACAPGLSAEAPLGTSALRRPASAGALLGCIAAARPVPSFDLVAQGGIARALQELRRSSSTSQLARAPSRPTSSAGLGGQARQRSGLSPTKRPTSAPSPLAQRRAGSSSGARRPLGRPGRGGLRAAGARGCPELAIWGDGFVAAR